MFIAFVAHLARPASVEASAIARLVGTTEYEARLALASPPPCVVLSTGERARAEEVVSLLRGRGHGAHVFDEAAFVRSDDMPRLDDFRFENEGVRRRADEALLPFGDVFAILRAVHDRVKASSRPIHSRSLLLRSRADRGRRRADLTEEREHVAYFFRRSGEAPWLLRERRASYEGLGDGRAPVAFTNFVLTVDRMREQSTTAIFDDRLVRRRAAERLRLDPTVSSSSDGIDLLAHLLAMTIASQGGSPYR